MWFVATVAKPLPSSYHHHDHRSCDNLDNLLPKVFLIVVCTLRIICVRDRGGLPPLCLLHLQFNLHRQWTDVHCMIQTVYPTAQCSDPTETILGPLSRPLPSPDKMNHFRERIRGRGEIKSMMSGRMEWNETKRTNKMQGWSHSCCTLPLAEA